MNDDLKKYLYPMDYEVIEYEDFRQEFIIESDLAYEKLQQFLEDNDIKLEAKDSVIYVR